MSLENYQNGHELYEAYCNFESGKASAHDAKVCHFYDVQPWENDALARVVEVVADHYHESRPIFGRDIMEPV